MGATVMYINNRRLLQAGPTGMTMRSVTPKLRSSISNTAAPASVGVSSFENPRRQLSDIGENARPFTTVSQGAIEMMRVASCLCISNPDPEFEVQMDGESPPQVDR